MRSRTHRFAEGQFGCTLFAGILCLVALVASPTVGVGGEQGGQDALPLVLKEDFSGGADRWQPMDPKIWKVEPSDEGSLLRIHTRKGSYSPPHRSPFNITLLEEVKVGDFVLEVKVRSTIREYGHRDVCLVFGYQDPAHFYYVHFASRTDNHANQVFIVNDAARKKISNTESKGVNWSDGWHRLKIVRTISDGTIKAYFDDMETPIMTAKDTTFGAGQIGIGCFDDTADFAEVTLRADVAAADVAERDEN